MNEVKCPLCGENMQFKTVRKNEFYECPVCKAELWPYDEFVEKEIRKEMMSKKVRKKRTSSRRGRVYKNRKFEKTPWYKRLTI